MDRSIELRPRFLRENAMALVMEAEDIKETMKAEQCSAEEAIRIRKENEELTKIIEHYCIQSMQLCSSTLKDLRKLQKVGHDKTADDPQVQERG